MSRVNFFLKSFLLLFCLLCSSELLIAGNFTWKNTAASSTWEDPANWTGGTVPVDGNNQVAFTTADNITIVTSTNAPVLGSNQTIGQLTVSSGSLTIGSGFILNVTGTGTIAGGTTVDGSGEIKFGTVSNYNLSIGGATGATVNCSLSGSLSSLLLRNNTFGSTSVISLKVTNSTGYYNIGGNTFEGPVTFESAGNTGLRFSDLGEDKFNNDVTFICSGGAIFTSYNYNTTYKGNIVVKSTGLGVYFGNPSGTSTITSTLQPNKTITANNFTSGVLTLKNFIQQGASTPQEIILGGNSDCLFTSGSGGSGPLTTFESEVTVIAPIIHLNGGRFKEKAVFSATSTATSTGGNIYEKESSFNFNNTNVNGYWLFNGIDQYQGDATFINNNVGIFYVGYGTATFGGNVTFDNKSTGLISLAYTSTSIVNFTNPSAKAKFIVRGGSIRMADNGTTSFDCNVEVNSNGGTIYTVVNNGKTYLKSGRTIAVGEDLGFSQGTLDIKNFIQEGTTSQSLVLPCDGSINNIYLRSGCDFSGNLTVQARQILLQGGIYRGTTDISMCYNSSASINNVNTEAITFIGDAYIRNKGAANMSLGYGTLDMTFEGNAYFYITGTGHISLSSVNGNKTVFAGTDKKVIVTITSENNAAAGSFYFGINGLCEINSDVELNNNATANIVFGSTSTGNSTLAAGKTISVAEGAFSHGGLYFRKFIQYGNAEQNIKLTGSSTIVWFDPGSVFNGELNVSAPRVVLNGGSVFNGICTFEKTGGTIDNWKGGNEFYDKVTIKSSGTSYLLTGHSGLEDHFYDDVTFWNISSGGMYISHAINTQFDGNILCKNTGTGIIAFGNGNGIPTIATGKSISTEGFTSSGGLLIKNFKQLDVATPQSLVLSNTGTGMLTLGANVEFNGEFTASAPNFNLGGTYRGGASFTKTGAGNSLTSDAHFEEDVVFNNLSSNVFNIGATNWAFDGNVTFNNNSTGSINISNISGGLVSFNGEEKLIEFNNASTGSITIGNYGDCFFDSDLRLFNSTGIIYFGTNGGKVNLTSNALLTAPTFSGGTISFRNFLQQPGSPDIDLDLTGVYVAIGNTNKFYSNLKIKASLINFTASEFHGPVEFIASNTTTTVSHIGFGGSIFYSDLTITNNTSRPFVLGNISGNIYHGNVIVNKNSTGPVYLSNYGISEYHGNIIYNVISPNVPDAFGINGGTTVFTGDQAQSITSNHTTLTVVGGGIKMDKSANDLTLDIPLNVTGPVTFVKGNIISSATNTFSFGSNTQTVTGASEQSFIQGVARRFGNTTFTFPVGSGGKYMPISISAPSSNEDIRVEAFLSSPPNATTLDNTLSRLSSCQYWNVQRVTGSSNISLTLPWTTTNCEAVNTRDVSVAQFKNNIWQIFGRNNINFDGTNGSVTSDVPVISGFYSFGYIPFEDIAYGKLSSKMDGGFYTSKGKTLYFTYLEQYATSGFLHYKIYSNPSDIKTGTVEKAYGQNFVALDLQTLSLTDGKMYILEVTDEKNRRSFLKFEYKLN